MSADKMTLHIWPLDFDVLHQTPTADTHHALWGSKLVGKHYDHIIVHDILLVSTDFVKVQAVFGNLRTRLRPNGILETV